MLKIAKLHYITHDHEGVTHEELAQVACEGGVQWVQLRVKGKQYTEWLRMGHALKEICTQYEAQLIVNDNVRIARDVEADGVHLGKMDMDPREARQVLGDDFIIGGTANTIEDVERLVRAGVDYIGLGPFQPTRTKKKLSPILGHEGVASVQQKAAELAPDLALVVVGGVASGDVPSLMNCGVHGVAVSSAISMAEDRLAAAQELTELLGRYL